MQILIVDENALSARAHKRMLSARSPQGILIAHSIESARDLFISTPPITVVLFDVRYQRPEPMHGYEFYVLIAQELRERGGMFVAMTVFPESALCGLFRQLGISVLIKPFTSDEFYSCIRSP
jgi:DNA-binding NarL/FixJ family response regulator